MKHPDQLPNPDENELSAEQEAEFKRLLAGTALHAEVQAAESNGKLDEVKKPSHPLSEGQAAMLDGDFAEWEQQLGDSRK